MIIPVGGDANTDPEGHGKERVVRDRLSIYVYHYARALMKKLIFSAIIGAVIFGSIGFLTFVGYGAGNCDVPGKACDCFCCHMFGLRGYESCGDFGLLIGIVSGIVVGIFCYRIAWNR